MIDAPPRPATVSDTWQRSLDDPDAFWLEQAERLDWIAAPAHAGDWSFAEQDFHVRWFADGVLNVAANCIDRHLAARGEQVAILWEPDDPAEQPRRISYTQLHAEVCRFANVLKAQGVATGDRVTIYMPMIPEAAFAMLACARIGAVHSVVFGGFSADALAGQMADCGSTIVITADEGRRGGKRVALKACVDQAAAIHPGIKRVVVVRATGMPHDVKGQGIYAYVTLNAGIAGDTALADALKAWVRREIGPIATPDAIQFALALPKTRSGKIMRRILRKIAEGDTGALGDTSTLADPDVIDRLVADRVAFA